MSVGDHCSRTLNTITRTESVQEAAHRMFEHHAGTLVVVDHSNRAQGLVTDRDIVMRCVAKEFDPRIMTVAEVMTEPAQTIDEGSAIGDALQLMADEEIRRVIVVTNGGRITGLLALDDVVALMAAQAAEMGRLLQGQVHV
jgi:signal-transduction protein with cAMP-binding, CBS, and nucleotidyltransferase domain